MRFGQILLQGVNHAPWVGSHEKEQERPKENLSIIKLLQSWNRKPIVSHRPLPHWPYPFWIAHRGAGTLAPENTLAAFQVGLDLGYRMFECDAKLSADGVAFLLHDSTLDRTSNGTGSGGAHTWAQLSQLDAGSWHQQAFKGEGIPSLAQIGQFCLQHSAFLNIEIKPSPGSEHQTGVQVGLEAADIGAQAATLPLLTSFQSEALLGAKYAAPHLPRGLLFKQWSVDILKTALALQCVAVVGHHPMWTAERVSQCHAAGLRCLAYTVNDPQDVQHLRAMRIDGIVTDRVDLFNPDA